MTATTSIAGWVFSQAVNDLSARRVALNKLTVGPELSAEELAAMWDALAADFAEAGYPGMADGCVKRAKRVRGERG